MITAIVQFDLPSDSRRDDVIAVFRQSVPRYRDRPGLIRKYYLLDESAGKAGAVYLWENRVEADKTYDDAWRRSFVERYGAEPKVTLFDTPVVIDNLAGETIGDSGDR